MFYKEKIKLLKINLESLDGITDFINEEKSLNDISLIHGFLINEVMNLHKEEESHVNNKFFSSTCDARQCICQGEHGKRGGGIYIFNDKETCYYMFGDIHSDSITITNFLKKIKFLDMVLSHEKMCLIFLGDYVDRGHGPFKTIELILILKWLFPDNVFLLRGNHDGGTLISKNEYKLCVGRNEGTTDDDYFTALTFNKLKSFNMPLKLLENYHNFFNSLCTIALIRNEGEVVMGVHGGIPRPQNGKYDFIRSLSDLGDETIVDRIGRTIVNNILWSDPAEDVTMERPEGGRFYFYEHQFNEFIEKFSISKLIRGHQVFDGGYKEFFQGKLISIFSSGETPDSHNDETAYDYINPCILKLYKGSQSILRL